MTQEQFEKQLQSKDFEDNTDFFYLDSKGKVTIGVGVMFNKVEDVLALRLKFTNRFNFKTATDEEVKEEYKKIKLIGKGKHAHYYQKDATLKADSIRLNIEFKKRLKEATKFAQRYFENDNESDNDAKYKQFNKLPEDVQFALIDMSFNLGYRGLSKFTTLKTMLRQGKWAEAAEQSHRNGIQPIRNKKIFDWIGQSK